MANEALMSAAKSAGQSRVKRDEVFKLTDAIRGAANFTFDVADEVVRLQEARRNEDFSKLDKDSSMYFGGNSTYGVTGAFEKITESSMDYDSYEEQFQGAVSSYMDADALSQRLGVSKKNAEAWIEERGQQFSDIATRSASEASVRSMKAQMSVDFGGADGNGGKRALVGTDLSKDLDTAITDYQKEYNASHPEIWDPQGLYSMDNMQTRVYVEGLRAETEGKRMIEQLSISSDMTLDEMVEEATKGYSDRMSALDLSSDANAKLSAIENEEVLKETLRSYAATYSGNMIENAEGKGIRFDNLLTEKRDAGITMDDEEFLKSMEETGLDSNNRFDQQIIRGEKIAYYGYDKDLSGKYPAADSIMSDPELLANLAAYRSNDVTATNISVYDSSFDETMNGVNNSSGSVTLNTRYGDFIQAKTAEHGLSAEETEYLSRSLNQYAHTASEYQSAQWESNIRGLLVSPEVTEAEYKQDLQNLRNNGFISDDLYNEYINKKSSPWANEINKAEDALEVQLSDAFGESGLAKRYLSSGENYERFERMVTNMMNAGGGYNDKTVNEFINSIIRTQKAEDLSDLIIDQADTLISDMTDYNPFRDFSTGNSTVWEMNQAFENGEYQGVFNTDSVAAGNLYLQGSPSTRTKEGLMDAVTKSIYGDSATFDELSDWDKEMVKANAAISLAQFAQYQQASSLFERTNHNMYSVHIEGQGMGAIDDEGYFYFPQGDGSFLIGYVSDPNTRKELLSPTNNSREISLSDYPDVKSYRQREQKIEIPEKSEAPYDKAPPLIQGRLEGIQDAYEAETVPYTETKMVRPTSDNVYLGILDVLAGRRNTHA